MNLAASARQRAAHFNSNRYRWVFWICLLSLGIGAGAAGTVLFLRWEERRSLERETSFILDQTSQQLVDLLESRQQAMKFLRDALDRAPAEEAQRTALAVSAMDRLPHLVGIGWMDRRSSLHWWVPPEKVRPDKLPRLALEIHRRTWFSRLFSRPSTSTLFPREEISFWAVTEPFHMRSQRSTRLVALFDLKPFLADLFKRIPRPHGVRLRDDEQELYRSPGWGRSNADLRRSTGERILRSGGVRWVLEVKKPAAVQTVPRSWFNVLVAATFALLGLAVFGMVWATEHLRQLATTDELTGLFNRRFFMDRWEVEVERAKRYARRLSCLMIDIDGFKQVNDLLGHPTGDLLLKTVAQRLKGRLRRTDLVARLGGDEFVVALPETTLAQALSVAEKIRGAPLQGPWADDLRIVPLTLSVGAAQLQEGESSAQALQRADANLYALRRSFSLRRL